MDGFRPFVTAIGRRVAQALERRDILWSMWGQLAVPYGYGLAGASCLLALASCGGSPSKPSLPGITLGVSATITGKYVACSTCDPPLVVSTEFPVVVGDPDGPGGTVRQVEVVAVETSRGTEIARNIRPNADFVYPVTAVPKAGSLTLAAGVVISPAPPPRDSVNVTVTVRLEDGRASTASAALAVAEAGTTAAHRSAAGGLSTRDVIALLHALESRTVGADVVELNATRDIHGVTAMVAARFEKELAGLMLE